MCRFDVLWSHCHPQPHANTLIQMEQNGGWMETRIYDKLYDGHRKKNGKNLCFCCNCIHIDYKNRHVQATKRLFVCIYNTWEWEKERVNKSSCVAIYMEKSNLMACRAYWVTLKWDLSFFAQSVGMSYINLYIFVCRYVCLVHFECVCVCFGQ